MSFNLLLLLLAVLSILLVVSIVFNVRLTRDLFKIQDGIEESLDVLDQTYMSVTNILERPVFFDSVEVRQVINEINKSREAVLYVANVMGQVEVVEETSAIEEVN